MRGGCSRAARCGTRFLHSAALWWPGSPSRVFPRSYLPRPLSSTVLLPTIKPIGPDAAARVRRVLPGVFIAIAAYYALMAVLAFTRPHWGVLIVLMVVAGASPLYLLFRLNRRTLGLTKTELPALPFPLAFYHTLATYAGFAIFLSFLFVPIMIYGPHPLLIMLLAGPLALALVHHGNKARELGELCCPGCNYPAAGLTFPTRCPECARPLEALDTACTMPKAHRPAFTWAGRLLGVGAIVLTLIMLARPGPILGALPRPVLLALAATSEDAFGRLNTAALTPDERDALIGRVLDARPRARALSQMNQLGWVGTQLVAGSLSAGQADRFASEGYRLGIMHRGDPAVGDEIEISLTGGPPPHGVGTVLFNYYFAGFEINNQAAPARADSAWMASFLGSAWDERNRLHADPKMGGPTVVPMLLHRPTVPGPLHIRARIIAVTTPVFGGLLSKITWHDDGSYTITPEPLTTHELTAETTITINP